MSLTLYKILYIIKYDDIGLMKPYKMLFNVL